MYLWFESMVAFGVECRRMSSFIRPAFAAAICEANTILGGLTIYALTRPQVSSEFTQKLPSPVVADLGLLRGNRELKLC